ncbi:DUF4232 domain-containing protein [Parafrankia elaeagni]|uniref:DUF4232 domain-containing protein n=1 Tax=Parafrankia elaeagni TaxID=222534 RepID=UPI0003713666|nr:DUF4232 domain-containing protein [Parafrankia elaeagni]
MRGAARRLPALAAFLLLAACGYGYDYGVHQTSVTIPPVDGVRITSMTVFSGRFPPCPEEGKDLHDRTYPVIEPADERRISAAYEVTNADTEAFTYTIRFAFIADPRDGVRNEENLSQVEASEEETVRAVGPGVTVRGTVRQGMIAHAYCPVTRVRVTGVTRVPTTEAPPGPDECPPGGLRLTVDGRDGSMGLRQLGLRLENCGTRDHALDGYPLLELLDTDRARLDGVQIRHGSGGVWGMGPGFFDEPARPLVLAPGESAYAGLAWRMDSTDIPYLRVRAQQGAAPVTLTPHLDLGATGTLAVSPWTRR